MSWRQRRMKLVIFRKLESETNSLSSIIFLLYHHFLQNLNSLRIIWILKKKWKIRRRIKKEKKIEFGVQLLGKFKATNVVLIQVLNSHINIFLFLLLVIVVWLNAFIFLCAHLTNSAGICYLPSVQVSETLSTKVWTDKKKSSCIFTSLGFDKHYVLILTIICFPWFSL